jgi:hypothetical protein
MNSTLLYGSCVSLFAYIQGNNDQAANINMTAPVRVDMFPSTGSSHNTTLIMHLYWPPKHQFNPPPPPPPNQARPMKLPKHRYAALKRFGGFMNDSNIHEQVLALKKASRAPLGDHQ